MHSLVNSFPSKRYPVAELAPAADAQKISPTILGRIGTTSCTVAFGEIRLFSVELGRGVVGLVSFEALSLTPVADAPTFSPAIPAKK